MLSIALHLKTEDLVGSVRQIINEQLSMSIPILPLLNQFLVLLDISFQFTMSIEVPVWSLLGASHRSALAFNEKFSSAARFSEVIAQYSQFSGQFSEPIYMQQVLVSISLKRLFLFSPSYWIYFWPLVQSLLTTLCARKGGREKTRAVELLLGFSRRDSRLGYFMTFCGRKSVCGKIEKCTHALQRMLGYSPRQEQSVAICSAI